MSNNSDISTPSETQEQSQTISISNSPEEHQKHAKEWAQRALARLTEAGEKAAKEAQA